ncbi:helix-turn-helix domain-containing protein [Halorubrum sp. SD626R]|jgi:predicted DNA binding protein|uniref:helix-turn-helix domain-containing protein n=1 Tax=Halorubrum sp. SD626R TaxID=1419722 RepID=UPI000AE112AA|nr:helix-turn-helix domain-containing protein [Halorubrum sp. SD626R]TKX81484.1 helix-turn-helix domain-containing protein [Halorubrum sp. SD626R]
MREVTLRIRHRGGPESEVSARHPEVTMRSVSSMTGRGSERKRIVELRGPTADIESFIREFRAADDVVEAEPLSPVNGTHAYVAVVVDTEGWEGIRERLAEMGIHYRTGTTIVGGIERWTVYIEPDDDLSAVIRELERGGNDVELARNVELASIERPPGLPASGILDGLTSRQREVLATAIAVGYYDHEGGVGVEDVADEIGLGSTTVWEHLSRAESTVMNALFDRFEG